MSIAEKLTTIAENEQKVFDAGKKAEYDRFWDVALEDGSRTNFHYAFAGPLWNDETFKPKYDLVPNGNANHMFTTCGISDLKARLEAAGITLDVRKAIRTDFMFYYSRVQHIPVIDVRGSTYANGLQGMFQSCTWLHTIDKLIIPFDRELSAANTAFNGCTSLENLLIEGVISTNSWNFGACPLSKASITSIVNALSATTTGLTITLKKTAVEAAFGSTTASEWTELVATKPNWTISLA